MRVVPLESPVTDRSVTGSFYVWSAFKVSCRYTYQDNNNQKVVMDAFLKFRADRAFTEGMQAYRDGQPNHAPARYFEHSGDWVRGWSAAWLAESLAAEQAAKNKVEPAQLAAKQEEPA